jgi:hypothetical protein
MSYFTSSQGHFRIAQQQWRPDARLPKQQAGVRRGRDDGHRAPHRIGILRALLTVVVLVVGWGRGGGR